MQCIIALKSQPARFTFVFAVVAVLIVAAVTSDCMAADSSANSTSQNSSQLIDDLVSKGWKENGFAPSKTATDSEWCRRVYLDVLGRIPTVDELNQFLKAKRTSQRDAELVDRLLGPDYVQEYARNWTTIWTNTLIGRTGGTDRRSPTSRPGMMQYLERVLLENKPYHLMARDLITATGDARPDMDNFNGAANFLVEKLAENGVQATAKTSQIFLGMNVQCTQCHNHPFNEYQQNQFWEMNAFFRQTRRNLEQMMDDDEPKPYATLVDDNFGGEGRMMGDRRREVVLEMRHGKLVDRDGAGVHAAPTYYELRNGQVRVAYPVFVDGSSLAAKYSDQGEDYGNSGAIEQINRRKELAELVLGSEQLEQSLVNRYWAHFFGHGFTKPIDDMGPHNPPSHPELLEILARDFRDSEFDLKGLIRRLVLSKPYRLSSRMNSSNVEDDPALGRPPMFSRFYVRQMQAEQLFDSLLVATKADAQATDDEKREMMKDRWLRQFSTAFGNDEGTESTSFNGSIPQVLTLMNGDLTKKAIRTKGESFLGRIANDPQLSNADKFNYLYQAGLSRKPSKQERKICTQLLASRKGDVARTLQDVWWAVLNSNEFILIH
ncbi:DUF1549 and DUF1553 domain-containing protein [Adhaeretor mobilis]|uniref:Secreted protein containing DUF1549 n=1 Tax=Adhaeretor mobilis TaxID=1930276 RepID=A0A517MS37_9BACT|nr:DUF1549 and DUF1553 domain-containing protein [Adhaeretor mobilis]QDS97597.1 hypothetical protein HG15A2_08600 [Adhaeretor mobilis]